MCNHAWHKVISNMLPPSPPFPPPSHPSWLVDIDHVVAVSGLEHGCPVWGSYDYGSGVHRLVACTVQHCQPQPTQCVV